VTARDRIALGLVALAVAERNAILARIRERTFPLRLAERAIADADRLIESTRTSGRTGYQRAARQSIGYGRTHRPTLLLYNRLGWSGPLARLSKARFDVLVSQRAIFSELEAFVDARIRRLHGRRVADLLQQMLNRRRRRVDTALQGLSLQFPGYAEELSRRMIQRTALRLEEREYAVLREQALVGDELYTALLQEIVSRRAIAEQRLELDLVVQRTELVEQHPLFAELDEPSRRQLARHLRTRYARENTVIVDKERIDKRVYFIVSGAVEIEHLGRATRMGRGEMFGAVTFLPGRYRRLQARTLVPSTLLMLDETRFRHLLERSATLRQRLRDASADRN